MIQISDATRILALIFLALALSSGRALAQDAPRKEAFTPERFAELQEEGALILLDVFADWCPTCAIQQQVLSDFRAEHPDLPLHTLTIDFDQQKEFVRRFRAPRQSTLILYRGKDQIWFSVAETSADVIFSELRTAAASPDR